MEEAESEKNGFDFGVFVVNFFSGEVSPSSLHVGLESLWGFAGQLDRSVQDSDGNFRRWVGSQEEFEVGISSSGFGLIGVEDLLEFGKPSRHQVDIFQHDPVSFLVSFFDSSFSEFVHTLSKSHGEEVFAWFHLELLADLFDFLDGVSSGRKDKEDRSVGVGIFDGFLEDISESVLGVHVHIGVSERKH